MLQTDSDIRSRLLVARLPAMPQILLKLLEHCQNDDAGMGELASLIAKDPGIASKILSVANSSAYHRNGQKAGLEQSLASIGTDMVKTLVISESVFQIFNNISQANNTDLRGFWKHSLSAAVIAREIAVRMKYPHVEEAYLAGLLHDVGRLALLAAAPKEYATNFMAADDANLCAVEQRTLQMTHAEAGAMLVERWHLDSFLADSVLYHHESVARVGSAHPLIRIVILAHMLSSHEIDDPVLLEAGLLCGIDAEGLADIGGRAADLVRQAADYLGIDLAGADDITSPPATVATPSPDPTRDRLSEEVRNLVLATNAGRSFARSQSEAELLETVTRSARILFGFDDAIMLQMDATGHALVGCAVGPHRQRLSEFSVPLSADGPVANAANQLRVTPLRRTGKLLGVGEEQLLRMMGTNALVSVPLSQGGRCIGVLVGGLSPEQLFELQPRERFMQAFAAQASTALAAAGAERSDSNLQLANVAEDYRQASRRVAHEVNNPLSIIKNYLSILDSKLQRQEPVSGELSILNEEIDRVGQIVHGMVEMEPAARSSAGGGSDVNRVAGEVVRLFRDTEFVPASVRIVTRLDDQPSEIAAGADLVKQILVNLLKNAVEAMPRGGEIEVANNGHLNRDGRLYLELSIRDTGGGMAPEIMTNLFAPGRSTKDGAHRGLGLSIVQSLVRQIDGMILCRSNKQGTTFEILLPVPVPVPSGDGVAAGGKSLPRSAVAQSQMMDSL
ncbi:MAG: HDOD domain-containing protein [Herminiimonas sp.]|nr:HDOD domain-containing protein [Herminiimonas sp.]